jgi:septin family protein
VVFWKCLKIYKQGGIRVIIKREVAERSILDKFVEDFCKIIDKHVGYFICSGFNAIASGRTRGTEDIDMIIEKMSKADFIILQKDLEQNGFECLQSQDANKIYDNYLIKNVSVRYVRKGEHLPEMKLHFAKDDLDEMQIKERIKMPLTELDVFFAPLEGNIAFKEELLASEKDLEDAKHLRIVYEGKFNEEKIKKLKKRIKEERLKEE